MRKRSSFVNDLIKNDSKGPYIINGMKLLLCEATCLALHTKRRMHVFKMLKLFTFFDFSELSSKAEVFYPQKPLNTITSIDLSNRYSLRRQSQMIDSFFLTFTHHFSDLPYYFGNMSISKISSIDMLFQRWSMSAWVINIDRLILTTHVSKGIIMRWFERT